MEKLRADNLPRWVRWCIHLIVPIIIIVGAIFWIISTKGSIAGIISITFAALGLLFSFYQVFPIAKSHHVLPSSPSPASLQPQQIVIQLAQTVPIATDATTILPNTRPEEIIATHPLAAEMSTILIPQVASQLREDWGEAPSVEHLYGRTQECATLRQWLVEDRCRVVALLGIGGVGKTSVASVAANLVKTSFAFIFWRSLQNAPAFSVLVTDCIRHISGQQQVVVPGDIGQQIALLLRYLQEHRCLLVLDNMESVMQEDSRSGQYQAGYEGYGRLLQRMGETDQQSCLLLTSREKPREIALLEGSASPTRVLSLSGVGQKAGKELLADAGLFGSDEAWTNFIHLYAGNPLALKLAAEAVRELFAGDLARFLQEGGAVFGDIYDLLEQQFHRLSAHEQELLYWLAIEREAVSLETVYRDLVHPVPKGIFLEVLKSLRRRSMIELHPHGAFTLQPVIMEYITAGLVAQVVKEITSGRIHILGSHALLKAHAQEYVRESQVRLTVMPVGMQLCTHLGREKTEHKLRELLSTLRKTHTSQPGYAPGNILNLLLQLQSDLRGVDFSHLPVWQAYLQGAVLPDVNFSSADLASSVFTETFGNVLAVALSPNQQLLAAGTATGEIQLWQLAESVPFLTLQGHLDWVRTIAFSPDGTTLASGSDDQSIRLWDISNGHCLNILREHSGRIYSLAYSADGNTLASGSDDQTVRLWQSQTGQPLNVFHGHSDRVRAVVFSPDGTILASGSEDKTVRLWQVSSGESQLLSTFSEGLACVYTIAFNSDGSLLASGGDERSIRLWQVSTGRCLHTFQGHSGRVYSLAFGRDGDTIASAGDDQSVHIWQVGTGECLKVLQGHSNRIRSIAFGADGDTLVSGGDDQSVRVWQVYNGQCLKVLQGHSSWIYSVAFSPDGSLLAYDNEDRNVRLWSIKTEQCVQTLRGHTSWVYSIAFSPDGNLLASGSDDQTVCLWQVHSGQCLKVLSGHSGRVRSVAFSPDGNLLASGSDDQTIRLWQVSTGQCLKVLQGHSGRVRSVAFSSDGSTLVSGSDDHTVRLWRVNTGQPLQILTGHIGTVWSATFNHSGTMLASGSDDQMIRLWGVSEGQCLHALSGHTGRIYSVAFSPDDDSLVSGSEDQSIRLWEVSTGQCLHSLMGHGSRVRSVCFNATGTTLTSGSHDGTVKLWDRQTGHCTQTLRSDKPYERMNITGIKGVTPAQKAMLKTLGAIENL